MLTLWNHCSSESFGGERASKFLAENNPASCRVGFSLGEDGQMTNPAPGDLVEWAACARAELAEALDDYARIRARAGLLFSEAARAGASARHPLTVQRLLARAQAAREDKLLRGQ